VGQAVSVVPSFSMTDYPMHGEAVLAPVHAVVAHPEELSFEQAAAVWNPFTTAYGGLVDIAGVRPGDTVLIPAASREAVIVLYGLLESSPAPLNVGTVLFKHLTLRGFELFEITTDDARRAAAVDYVREGLAKGELAPVIDTTFPLDAIAEAHRYLEAGGQVGKIVITVTPEDGRTS
jgi:NADPH:quinone reductase-like Zn-dependent oxidoreductase